MDVLGRCQTKVSDFDVKIFIHHYVFWLEVTMHYIHVMHVAYSISDLLHEKPANIFCLFTDSNDDIEKGDRNIFHYNILGNHFLTFIGIINESIRSIAQQFHDVTMVKLTHHAHLLLE